MTTQQTQPEKNDTQVTVVEDSPAPDPASNTAAASEAAATEETSPPSFAALIEEFRHREERMAAGRVEPAEGAETSTALASATPISPEMQDSPAQETNVEFADAMNRVSTEESATAPEIENDGKKDIPAAKPQRLVPPPLRPSTRMRMPRQGGGRARESFVKEAGASSGSRSTDAAQKTQASTTPEEPSAPTMETTATEPIATTPGPGAEAMQVKQSDQPKPARRYRFDRREPATHSMPSSKPVSLAPSPTEATGAGRAQAENSTPEQSLQSTGISPISVTEPESVAMLASEAVAPAAPATHAQHERRRRHGQEGQVATQPSSETGKDAVKADATRRDGQAASSSSVSLTEEMPTGLAGQAATEIPVEDLPPLEYSELQAASRRRRRRRTGNGAGAATPAPGPANKAVTQVGPASIAPVSPVTPGTPARTSAVPQPPYTIQSGMTVNQMNQGNEVTGPFQGPEPTPARGSVLPQQPRLTRSMRNGNEAQRGNVTGLPAARSGDGILSTGAVNHLANVISQAIEKQSDRMVAELRRTNQAGANVSITVPPFPSTERVGVFVDVANLLYSARTLRTTIDFGKLLDFLRGNRRLVRAHAYTPTSPQPGDDQMFLQAVKGLGYRITTKNYKTFASGAKKADMDLDLCMDVVRLVDARAVDTIVLVSGDSDFMPLLDYCSDHGVRVEVVAFDESMSATLRQSCDLFINLSMLDEIRVS